MCLQTPQVYPTCIFLETQETTEFLLILWFVKLHPSTLDEDRLLFRMWFKVWPQADVWSHLLKRNQLLKRYESCERTDAKPQQNMVFVQFYSTDVILFSMYDVSLYIRTCYLYCLLETGFILKVYALSYLSSLKLLFEFLYLFFIIWRKSQTCYENIPLLNL